MKTTKKSELKQSRNKPKIDMIKKPDKRVHPVRNTEKCENYRYALRIKKV